MKFLIQNGMIYDPVSHRLKKGDVALADGRIAAPEDGAGYRQVIDAEGCLVMPGLIDYHVHYFLNGTENGVNPDAASFCNGITTAVDGGSCGAGSYELYRRSVMAQSEVRILNYLLVASGGQACDRYPENLDPALVDQHPVRHVDPVRGGIGPAAGQILVSLDGIGMQLSLFIAYPKPEGDHLSGPAVLTDHIHSIFTQSVLFHNTYLAALL